MGMHNAFYFDGESSLNHDVVLSGKEVLAAPEPDISEWEIPGRDGTVPRYNGRMKNVNIVYHGLLRFFKPWEMTRYAGDLKNWLLRSPGKYLRLEDTYDLDHYREAYIKTPPEFDASWRSIAKVDVTFSCKPYRYLKSGDDPIAGSAGSLALYNPTQHKALPQIMIALGGQFSGGDIKISTSAGYSETLSGVPRSYAGLGVLIDSENKTVSAYFTGDHIPSAELAWFPELAPGETMLTVTGSGLSQVTVTPRWREL